MALSRLASLAHSASGVRVRELLDESKISGGHREGWTTHGQRSLHQAVEFNKDEGALQALLELPEIDVNTRNNSGLTPLHVAALLNRESVAKFLLRREDLDVNPTTAFDLTPLHFAARLGRIGIVELLLADDRSNLDVKTTDDFTPLHLVAEGDGVCSDPYLVCRRGSVDQRCEVVRMILAEQDRRELRGLENEKDVLGRTAIHYAAENGCLQMVMEFLRSPSGQPDLNVVDAFGFTPLHLATQRGHVGVVELLLQARSIDINSHSTMRFGVGQVSMSNSNSPLVVQRLFRIYSHEEVVLETSINLTPLHIAAREGKLEIASLLLNSRVVNTLAVDSRGFTALHFAAAYGHTRVLKLLLEQSGIPVNACDLEGLTPLVHSVIRAHLEVVQSLLEYVRNTIQVPEQMVQLLTKLLAIATRHGVTHRAVALYLIDCIESLLETSLGKFQSTIVHWAAKNGNSELIELILPWRPDEANAMNEKKQTPLHVAATYGTIETVRSLCRENGWRLRAADVDKSGCIALNYAFERKGMYEMRNLLMRRADVKEYMDRVYSLEINTLNALFVGSALFASVTFMGWLQPPLGFQPDFNTPSKNSAAPPGSFLSFAVVEGNTNVRLFFIFNCLSFMFSLVTIFRGTEALASSRKRLVTGYVPRRMRSSVRQCFWYFVLSTSFIIAAFDQAGRAVIPPGVDFGFLYILIQVVWASWGVWCILSARKHIQRRLRQWWATWGHFKVQEVGE